MLPFGTYASYCTLPYTFWTQVEDSYQLQLKNPPVFHYSFFSIKIKENTSTWQFIRLFNNLFWIWSEECRLDSVYKEISVE